MSDKNDKKLVAKSAMAIVKKQIGVPSQPGDVIKDGLTALAPVNVFKVKDPSEIEASSKLIQAEIAKYPELSAMMQWSAQKMANAFDEFYATRHYSHRANVGKSSGMDYFREIITHLNTADDYGNGWRDGDNHAAFVMNLRAAIRIHKTTPTVNRYSMRADVSELRESIEDHRIVNTALAQYAEISEGFRTNLRDVGYIPLNNAKTYIVGEFKAISSQYTEKTILATYANLPFFIKKCGDKRKNPFPENIDFKINPGSEQHQAECIASELVGSWRAYSSDASPTDIRGLPHFKLAYELQRAITKDSKIQDGLVEEVIAQFLRAGEGVEASGLVMSVDHPLISYNYSSAGNWGVTSDFDRTIPKIGKPLYSFSNITHQMRSVAMTEANIPREVLIVEIVNYFLYVQALYRSLFTNHDSNKRGGFYYTRFHDSHYTAVSTRTKENSKLIVGSKRANSDDLIRVLTEDAARMFGREYIAQPHVDTPALLEWSSFLVHASRFTENDRGTYTSPRLSGLGVQCNAFRSTIESIRSTAKTINDIINDLIIERNFKPYAMLSAASELHDKIKTACGSVYTANNALIMRLSMSGYSAVDWADEGIGYSSTVARLGGKDPDPIEAFNPNRHLTGPSFDQPDSAIHKDEDAKKQNRMIELFKGKDKDASSFNAVVGEIIANPTDAIKAAEVVLKEEPKPENKPEDKAAE